MSITNENELKNETEERNLNESFEVLQLTNPQTISNTMGLNELPSKDVWTVVDSRRKKYKEKQLKAKHTTYDSATKSTLSNPAYQDETFLNIISAIKSLEIMEIICLGLGTLTSFESKHQYQILLDLKLKLLVGKVYLFDPLFTKEDQSIFDKDGLLLLQDNQGSYRVTNKTLFYMPHCPVVLYNNVLKANLENLSNVVIVGNSFRHYGLHLNSKDSALNSCLLDSFDQLTEIGISRSSQDRILNNSSLMTFANKRE